MKKKILLVGPIPPPFGGIAKYVSDLYHSTYLKDRFVLQLFNTAIPNRVRRFEKRNERSYLSFLSDGVIPGFKLLFYVLTTFLSFTGSLLNKKPAVVQVFTSSFWGFWRSGIYILIAKLFRVKISSNTAKCQRRETFSTSTPFHHFASNLIIFSL